MKIRRILANILAGMLGCCLVGCAESDSGNQKSNKPTLEKENVQVEQGLHIINVGETDYKIVDEGKTAYKLVYPENAGVFVERAVAEFTTFFYQATNITLESVKDSQVSYDQNSKYIILGDVVFAEQANHGFDMSKVNSSGYVIKTQGNSIFVLGGGDVGVLNGVYELLYQLIDWRIYGEEHIVYNKNVKNLKLKNFSICDSPDIEFNMSSYGAMGYANSTVSHRLRTYTDAEIWIPGTTCHSAFMLLPPETYEKEHPEWYAGEQLCYTAHGDAEEYEAMISTLVATLQNLIDEYPDLSNVSVTQRDFATWCGCEACQFLIDKYKGEAATQIYFINDVAERLEQWLKEERGGRKINIVIFAYHKTEEAPQIIDDDLLLHDMVSVWLAPITISYTSSPFDPTNIAAYKNFNQWSKITKSLYLWYYDVNFSYYIIPNNTYHAKQDWYKLAKMYGAKYCFNQGAWNSSQHSGFTNLKAWLNAKFGWNVHYDYNELLDEYFDNAFGPASTIMRQYFNELETNLMIHNDAISGIYAASRDKRYWNRNMLLKWNGYIDQAYQAIEKIKDSDEELYKIYKDNIAVESMTIRYLLVELYSTSFGEEEIVSFKKNFALELESLGFTRIAEGGSVNEYISELLKAL